MVGDFYRDKWIPQQPTSPGGTDYVKIISNPDAATKEETKQTECCERCKNPRAEFPMCLVDYSGCCHSPQVASKQTECKSCPCLSPDKPAEWLAGTHCDCSCHSPQVASKDWKERLGRFLLRYVTANGRGSNIIVDDLTYEDVERFIEVELESHKLAWKKEILEGLVKEIQGEKNDRKFDNEATEENRLHIETHNQALSLAVDKIKEKIR